MEQITIHQPIAEYAPLASYRERYQQNAGQHRALRVRVELNDGAEIIGYEPIHLDNLLCSQVVNEAWNEISIWEWQKKPADLPAPLKVLWRDARGLPYYACSVLLPIGDTVNDVTYMHKRAPSGQFSKGNKKTGNLPLSPIRGRWMERRIPFKSTLVTELGGYCVGDPAEIARLLQNVSHIGKKRSSGFGEVLQWHIEPAIMKSPLDCIIRDGKLIKPLPMDAAREHGIKVDGPVYQIGWTPPQWNPSGFDAGWAVGSKVA